MTGFWLTLFGWPNGIVVGNLIASAIWAVPAILHVDRLMRRHHRERMDLARKHHEEITNQAPGESNGGRMDSTHL